MEKQARVPELVQGGGLKILCVQSLVGSNPTSSIFCYFQKRGNWMEEARGGEGLCVGRKVIHCGCLMEGEWGNVLCLVIF